jgi:hypothetical protein
MKANEFVTEKWSQKYKSSINCSHPKGFSQKAHCAGKKKHNESIEMEMVCEDCGLCESHGNLNEIKKGQKDANGYTRCWPGKHAEGTKKGKNGGQVRACVPNESVELEEEFDLIESIIERLAQHNGVDAEVIWEDLETLTEDELYAFAVTSEPIMESQDMAEGWGGTGGTLGFIGGVLLGGAYFPGSPISTGIVTLSTALGAWLGSKVKDIGQDAREKYELASSFLVFVNGKQISANKVDYREAAQQIANMAEKEHDPNTFYTIYDTNADKIVWRFKITDDDDVDESVVQGVAESEAWQKANKRDKTDGMSQKSVNTYRREHPGSKLKTAVTTKPSKLKKGSKASKRRKSYCSRSRGQMKMHSISCAKTPDKAICKARRRWNC